MYRRIRTYGSCLQQPTHTVRIGHGSPPFQSSRFVRGNRLRQQRLCALPSGRGQLFEGDCRSWLKEAGKTAAGTPALVNPSTWPAAGLLLPAAPCREHLPLPDPHLKGPCGSHFLSLPHAHIVRRTVGKDQRKSHGSHAFFMCETRLRVRRAAARVYNKYDEFRTTNCKADSRSVLP